MSHVRNLTADPIGIIGPVYLADGVTLFSGQNLNWKAYYPDSNIFDDFIGSESEIAPGYFMITPDASLIDISKHPRFYVKVDFGGYGDIQLKPDMWVFDILPEAQYDALYGTGTLQVALTDDAKSSLVTAIWAFAYRTFTMTAAQVISILRGDGTIEARRGESWSLTLTGLGDQSGITEAWLTVKRTTGDTDAEAKIQITMTGGLRVLNGSAPSSSGLGSLTPSGTTAAFVLSAAATATLDAGTYVYDYQVKTASGTIETRDSGRWIQQNDVTRAVS